MRDIDARRQDQIIGMYSRHFRMLYQICITLLCNVSDAEDAVEETYMKIIERDVRFESGEHEKAYLITVAQNICRNKLKSANRNNENIDDFVAVLPAEQSENGQIMRSILELPEKYRLPIYLYYFEGYSTKEITKILGTLDSTVRSRLKRAREQLKELLSE